MNADGNSDLARLQAENKRLVEELEDLQKSRMRTTNSVPTRDVLQLREQLNQKDKEILDALEQCEAREREAFDARKQVRELERNKNELNDKVLAVEKDLVETSERMDWVVQSLEAAQREVAEWKARYDADFDEAKKMVTGALEEEQARSKRTEDELNAKYEKSIQRLSSEHTSMLREARAQKDSEIARLTTQVGELERLLASTRLELEGARGQLLERSDAEERSRTALDKSARLEGSLVSTRKALATILAVLERTTGPEPAGTLPVAAAAAGGSEDFRAAGRK